MARRSPALGPPSGVGSAERRRRSPPTSSRSCSIASPECGFVFQPALPVEALRSNHDEEYFEHYSAEGDYDAQGPQRRREARARLRWMREHGCDGGRLLEVGVARGDFPRRGPERGLRAAASRPSRNVCGSKKPTEVMVGWAEEVALPPASFDAVGIEPEPGCAAVARRRSGAGTACEVDTVGHRPDVPLGAPHAQGERWYYLDPDHHDARTILRRFPRRLAFSVRHGVRLRAPTPGSRTCSAPASCPAPIGRERADRRPVADPRMGSRLVVVTQPVWQGLISMTVRAIGHPVGPSRPIVGESARPCRWCAADRAGVRGGSRGRRAARAGAVANVGERVVGHQPLAPFDFRGPQPLERALDEGGDAGPSRLSCSST